MNTQKNNKNTIILVILIIFIITSIFGGYLYYKNKTKNKKIEINKNISKKNISKNDTNKKQNIKKEKIKKEKIKKEKIKNKIEEFKRKIAAKGLIIKGDIELQNQEYLFALKKFLEANKQTPNNPKILAKIAQTYFLMKNFSSAYRYYSKIPEGKYLDKNKKTLSFLYSQNLENKNYIRNSSGALATNIVKEIDEIKKQIKNFKLEKEQEFYYLNSLECIKSFHNCKLNFENYFKNKDYSGKNQNLENIRFAIDNYKKLKLNKELYYKNALIIGALMQNKNYPISIILSKDLLKEKTNYKPILKIIAQSYFELNKLKESSKYLLQYAKIDSNSPDVSYMIGVIAQKKRDFIKSNIFLKLALEQGYKDKISIYRLQLYNYLILGEQNKISKIFDKIIASQKIPKFNDLMLSGYYNIINNNYEKALLYINKGIKLYPKKEDFLGLKAWILIEKKDYKKAQELLEKASDINPRNALVTLNKGRIYLKKYKEENKIFYKAKAKFLFKKAKELDNTEIGKLADKYLKELEKEKSVE